MNTKLANILNSLIAKKAKTPEAESELIDRMAAAAGIEAGTVRQILRGEIETPPKQRLQGFAEVLGVALSNLEDAVEAPQSAVEGGLTALMSVQGLPDATLGAKAPEWVHLLPIAGGDIQTGDDRGPYHVADAANLIALSFANTERLPIDENHSTDLAAPRGDPAPARGWIVAMEARTDGIWGKVEWTEDGAELVAGRAYRGISPVVLHSEEMEVLTILRASLTNNPNLRGLTALHQQQENNMDWMKFLAGLLNLGADATEDQVKAALKAELSEKADGKGKGDGAGKALQSQLTEIGVALGVNQGADAAAILDAAKAAADGTPDVIKALQSENASLATKVGALSDGIAKNAATAFVDGEIKRGRAGVKPLRDHYIAMHMKDAGRVEKEIGSLPVLGPSNTLVTPPDTKDGTVALNAEQSAVAKMLGQDPEDYAKTLKDELNNEEAL